MEVMSNSRFNINFQETLWENIQKLEAHLINNISKLVSYKFILHDNSHKILYIETEQAVLNTYILLP